MTPSRESYLRTLLILGRASNLPTVWSNCLAGWLLAGGGEMFQFALLCVGATFLYLGGMFLNDAFDAGFDRQFRPERPIPAGAISAAAVWQWGFSWLALGLLCLGFLGLTSAALAVLLAGCIVLYDAVHKMFGLAPILMALCRFLLVILAAAAASQGITGLALWSGLVLACYIVGISYLARRESVPGPLRYWPILGLIAPIVLALIVNRGPYLLSGLTFSLLLILWTARSVYLVYRPDHPNVSRGVSSLLAGIVLVDMLAVLGGGMTPLTIVFVLAFATALLAQRFIPAT